MMIYCCFASAKDSSRLNGQVKRRLKPVKHAKITKVAKVYLFVLNSIKTRLIWSSKPISSCFSDMVIRRQATDKGKNSWEDGKLHDLGILEWLYTPRPLCCDFTTCHYGKREDPRTKSLNIDLLLTSNQKPHVSITTNHIILLENPRQ